MSASCACLDHVVGHSARLEFTVSPSDTAVALGSGSVNVLATPMAIAWCEAATNAATAKEVCGDCTTVGYTIEFSHLAPTLVGELVYCTARVESISGDRLVFSVELFHVDSCVGSGKITRVRVDRSSWA
jgi:fluoroacetyl-CoA thioesterase